MSAHLEHRKPNLALSHGSFELEASRLNSALEQRINGRRAQKPGTVARRMLPDQETLRETTSSTTRICLLLSLSPAGKLMFIMRGSYEAPHTVLSIAN
jgi:hypothetical protein